MKASDIPEANRLMQAVQHCEAFLEALPCEPLVLGAGPVTITVASDDPQRALLNQVVADFAAYMKREADEKLKTFGLEPDDALASSQTVKPSEITGFPEDDLPPPEDPA